jgi:subtilisin-like proprotein convertase family protein
MAFFSWTPRLPSVSHARVKTYRKRKSRTQRLNVELLEDRTLLSVLPPPVISNQQALSATFPTTPLSDHPLIGAQVMVDPYNPNDVVATASYDPNFPDPLKGVVPGLRIWYSIDAGASWSNPISVNNLLDPNSFATATAPQLPFSQNEHASLAFDTLHNFYIVSSEHDNANTSGAIALLKYSFSGGIPAPVSLDASNPSGEYVLYRWSNQDPAYNPVVGIDTNVPSFTDPVTGFVQRDSMANTLLDRFGNPQPKVIYVAWNTNFTLAQGSTPATLSRIWVSASDDGGFDFTTTEYVSDPGAPAAAPQIAFTQGSADGRVPGGQLTFVWNGAASATNPLFNRITIDRSFPDGRSASTPAAAAQVFTNTLGGSIPDATVPATTPPNNVPASTPATPPFLMSVNIADPNFGTLNDLEVTVNLVHPHLNQLRITLTAPDGTTAVLVNNALNPVDGNPFNPPQGLADSANLGVILGGPNNSVVHNVGTVFDDHAARSIRDGAATAPYIGHFRTEGLTSGLGLGLFNGRNAAALTGTWRLTITDNIHDGGTLNQFLSSWSLNFTSGISTTGFGLDSGLPVTYLDAAFNPATTVNGSITDVFPLVNAASGTPGVGPGISLAIDNTLGSFSPNQGNIYVAYTGYQSRTALLKNPNDTDIFLFRSIDAGISWSKLQVNDDYAIDPFTGNKVPNDNFSEGIRPQFMPNVAVDQSTGTLVATWYDARYDASQARMANYIATSLDGGNTFSAQTFLNQPKQAKDAITGKTITIEPVPGNQGPAGKLGFGDEQGLSVYGGHVYAAFSSNLNGPGTPLGATATGASILTQTVTIAAGPRIIAGDMGPIAGDFNSNGVKYNNTFTSDGTRQFTGFVAVFDRPVDPTSFTGDSVILEYRDTVTPASSPANLILTGAANFNVTGLDTGHNWGPGLAAGNPLAETFLVSLKVPLSGIGTYSYAILPRIKDDIRGRALPVVNPVGSPITVASTNVGQVITDNTTVTSQLTFTGIPPGQVIASLTVNMKIDSYPFTGDLRITLISPTGSRILLFNQRPSPFTGFSNGLGPITFDDLATRSLASGSPPYAGTFRPELPLSNLAGSNGNGIWKLEIADLFPFAGDFGTLASWSLTIQPGIATTFSSPGNFMDQNQDAITAESPFSQVNSAVISSAGSGYTVGDILTVQGGNFVAAAQLRVTSVGGAGAITGVAIVGPGAYTTNPSNPASVTGGSGSGARFNLSFSTSSPGSLGDVFAIPTPTTGLPFQLPYSQDTLPLIIPGPHMVSTSVPNNPATSDNLVLNGVNNAIDVTFDRNINPATFTTANILRMEGPLGPITPYIAPPGVTFSGGSGSGAAASAVLDSVGRVIAVIVSNGGTGYTSPPTVTFNGATGSGAVATANISGGVVTGVTVLNGGSGYSMPATPIPAGGTLDSKLTVTDSLMVNDLAVRLNITHAQVSDLTAVLIAPDGTQVQLFDGGTGANFTDTVFDGLAADSIVGGSGPYAGVFRPAPGIITANINSGGGGYSVGDILTIQGGKFGTPAQFRVTSVDASGAITGVAILRPGSYTVQPANPVSATGGAGGGANFTVSFGNALSALNGKNYQGTWTLRIKSNFTNGITGTLNGWSLNPFTVTPLTSRIFRISFPTQSWSGTYSVVIGPDSQGNYIQDVNGYKVDTNLNAGVDLLRGGDPNNGTLLPVSFSTGTVNTPLPASRTIDSKITVASNFLVQGVTVTLSIQHQNDPDLEATLVAPDGTAVKLFTGVGNTGSTPHANFTGTTLDDAAPFPIQLAPTQPGIGIGAGPYTPQLPLSIFKNHGSLGDWTLRIKSNSSILNGSLVSWTLTLKNSVPGSGLGEAIADQFTTDFRIFTQDPTNALAQQAWTAVGPAPIGGGGSGPEGGGGSRTGRIGGLAVDPSDPSGNTVYVAGASGSVWKTTNFLTTDENGPTYVPLTDLGPGNSLNTGSIAVFGRNNDPNQSIILVATGEGDTGTPGVGFLRSMDGGRTWRLLDSTTNADAAGNILPINDPGRNHAFVGTTSFKVIVDAKAQLNGEVIVYAALSGGNGGIWRSLDTGKHWTRIRAGNATDVVLSAGSADASGNLQILYAGFRGEGVFYTTSAPSALSLSLRNGGTGVPIRRDVDVNPDTTIPVGNLGVNPSGGNGRIVLAAPAFTGNPLQDTLYEGWLYAVVVGTDNHLQGLYLTKDFGLNWTKVRLPVKNLNPTDRVPSVPTNDETAPLDYDVLGNKTFAQGNYDVSLAVDPNNPSVVYVGGTADGNPYGFIRVDVTTMSDPYALVAYDNSNNDGGLIQFSTTGPISVKPPPPPVVISQATGLPLGPSQPYGLLPGLRSPYFNQLRDPDNPFLTPASLQYTNVARFNNAGDDTRWMGFDGGGLGGTDQHRLIVMRDPLTGHTRLIFGDDQGVFTGTDRGDGNPASDIGSATSILGSRNGNLQITQFYYGAVQPSTLAADLGGALFYGSAQDDGAPVSDPHLLDNGNLAWAGPGGDYTGVATDQTGSGTSYQYAWPCCGATPLASDFFLVTFPGGPTVSRVTGLLQAGDDPGNMMGQWPFLGGSNFAVNPIDRTAIVMSSQAGRVFRTAGPSTGTGVQWFPIADPGDLDGTYAPAMAFGAPSALGSTILDDFIYAGTSGGHIYVTFTGGGVGTPWTNISAGLSGGGVQSIAPNPNRGSREAYAVTSGGVFWMADSGAAGATWVNLTGNLFSANMTRVLYNDPAQSLPTLKSLSSIKVDWRYAIPDDFANPNGPKHPVLYVGGNGGVFRSLDKGNTWTYFPNIAIDGAIQEGGLLPTANVTDLALSLGNINPLNGAPSESFGRNMLVATTYGRGTFAIRLNDAILLSNGKPLSTYAVSPVAGPHVVSVSGVVDPDGVRMDGIKVTFSGPVDPVTFTAAKVNSVTNVFGNSIAVSRVVDITGGNPHNVYEIVFNAPATGYGFYRVSLGPNISDYAGYKMDQNQDGVNGEPNDVYSARFLYQPFVNHAPVITGSAANFYPNVTEDQTAASIPGTPVNSFVTGMFPASISDQDNATYGSTTPPTTAPVGIAVTGVDNSHGVWQYSLDNGTSWLPFGSPSNTSARLLEANSNRVASSNKIRFLPNASWDGTATFTFRAWDLTSGLSVYGADGGTADTSVNGGSTAYSATAATATIIVNFVNDQPSFTAGDPPAVNADTGAHTVASWVTNFNPGGGPDANESGQSVLAYRTIAVSNPSLFTPTGQPAVDALGNLTYTLAQGLAGTSTFTVAVQDNGGTQALAAVVAAGGSGYKVGDFLTVLGGTFFAAAQLQVTAIGAGGAVTGVAIARPDGAYTVQPTNPVSVTDVTTPAASGATFTLTYGGIDTSVSQTFTLTVNGPIITFSPATLPNATAGASYSQVLTASGGFAPYSNFTISAGALPAGLSLSSTGTISGTPTAAGNFSFTVKAQDSTSGPGAPYTGSQNYTLVVNAPVITFTPATLPGATAGVSYNQTLTASGGTAPYSNFTISAGALPGGLSLSTSGTISGTPTAVGTFNFTVKAQDSTTGPAAPYTGTQNYTLAVAAPTITFTPVTLPNDIAGAFYTQALAGHGGTAPYSNFTITAGSLPAGITLTSGGTIHGTTSAIGTFSFTVRAQDASTGPSAPYTGSQNYTLVVTPPFDPATLPGATAGAAYSQTLTPVAGSGPATNFSISSGGLPAGLTLSTSGVLSGTPIAVGTFNFTVSANDVSPIGGPFPAIQQYTLVVSAPVITFTPATLPNATAGASYRQQFTAGGGTAPYSHFIISAGALPAGLSLSATGTISGTPTAAGNFSFTVKAQDSTAGPDAPYTGSQSYTLSVNAPVITFTPTNLPGATAGVIYNQPLTLSGGTAPYSNFTITTGALPAGLSLSASGSISGTPSAVGSFAFTVQVQDSTAGPAAPYTGSKSYTLIVAAPTITFAPATLPNVITGVPYSQALTGNGGTAPYSNFTIAAGNLPAGFGLSPGGMISGTTTAFGTFNFTVRAQDSTTGPNAPYSGTKDYTLAVTAPFNPPTLPGATAGASYSQTLTPVPGSGPATNFMISSGALPAGLTLSSTGILAGTPTAVGNFSFAVTANDTSPGSGPFTANQSYTLAVAAPVITFTPGTLASATAGAAYTQVLTAGGGTAPYSNFTISAGALPAGLTLSSTGTISGTPTAVGSFTFTVRAQDSTTGPAAPYTGSQSFSLTVNAPNIAFTPATLPAATAGAAFSQLLTGTGGTAPYSNFTISAGALPGGLTLSSSGTISGMPTAVGSFSFTVKAQDSTTGPAAPYTGGQSYSLTVNPPVITISPATLTAATVGVGYSQTLTGVGGTAPYSHFSVSSGSLPLGLSLDAATGILSGTATEGGSFTFTVRVQDSTTGPAAPYTGSQSYSLTVNSPTITLSPTTLPPAQAGAAFNQTITASGGTAPYHNFTVTSGALPAGLTLDANTGVLGGTPAAVGSFSFTIQTTDSSGGPGGGGTGPFTGSQAYSLTVAPPVISFTPTSLSGATAGTAYSQKLTGAGGTEPYTNFTLVGGTVLPNGLTLSPSGTITGTPSAVGAFSFTVRAQDSTTGPAAPYTGTQNYTLTVGAPVITFTPAAMPAGLVALPYNQPIVAGGTTGPVTYAITAGSLPAGLALDTHTGIVGGTPTTGGTSGAFTVTATDTGTTGPGAPYTASHSYFISISAPGFTFDPATRTLTITGRLFNYTQATTADSSGVHTTYNFTMDGTNSESLPDTAFDKVVVNGSSPYNSALINTRDTYIGTDGQTHQATSSVTVGFGAKVQKLNAQGSFSDFMFLNNFNTIYAVAGSNDPGFINSTPGVKNVFVGGGSYSYMNTGDAGLNFYYIAGAKYVYGYAADPARDFAYQYDGSGPSTFTVSGVAYSMETGTDNGRSFFNEAVGFAFNVGYATHPGQDVAYFFDSPGHDLFTGSTLSSGMTSYDGSFTEFDLAVGFAHVYAYSFVAGPDYAFNYDPNKNTVVGFILLGPTPINRPT